MWVDNNIIIPDVIAQYIQSWLEDSLSEDIFSEMENTVKNYTVELTKKEIKRVYSKLFDDRKKEIKETLAKYEVDNLEEKNN